MIRFPDETIRVESSGEFCARCDWLATILMQKRPLGEQSCGGGVQFSSVGAGDGDGSATIGNSAKPISARMKRSLIGQCCRNFFRLGGKFRRSRDQR